MWSDLFSDSGVLVTQEKWDRDKVRIILQNVLQRSSGGLLKTKLRLIDSESLSCLFLSGSVFFPQQLSSPSLACDTFSLQQIQGRQS